MSIEEKTEEGLNSVELRDLLTEKITFYFPPNFCEIII